MTAAASPAPAWRIGYRVVENPIPHTCWDDPEFEGVLMDGCAGCDEAVKFPCRFCGYGHVFTTHSEAHVENGDELAPDFYRPEPEGGWARLDAWTDAPHVYDEGSPIDGPRAPIRLPRRTAG